MYKDCRWINEPRQWHTTDGSLSVVTDERTDFWRQTYYGFTRDTGHFYGRDVDAEFTAQLRVRANYTNQYDQAGIMVRADERAWVKAGIEFCDGRPCMGSVLTNGSSDWATNAFEGDAGSFWIRATVSKGVLRLQTSTDGQRWPILRLSPFPIASRYSVGPMCCTPERSGLAVEFSEFDVMLPANKDLHDLT